MKARIKQYIKTHPGVGTKGNWIRGIGWDQANFNSIMPTAVRRNFLLATSKIRDFFFFTNSALFQKDLSSDPDLAGLYIMLDRVDVHCTWVSRKAAYISISLT